MWRQHIIKNSDKIYKMRISKRLEENGILATKKAIAAYNIVYWSKKHYDNETYELECNGIKYRSIKKSWNGKFYDTSIYYQGEKYDLNNEDDCQAIIDLNPFSLYNQYGLKRQLEIYTKYGGNGNNLKLINELINV